VRRRAFLGVGSPREGQGHEGGTEPVTTSTAIDPSPVQELVWWKTAGAGVGLTVLLHLTWSAVMVIRTHDDDFTLALGLTQVVYVVPAMLLLGALRLDRVAHGVAYYASVTLLVNTALCGYAFSQLRNMR